MQLRFDPGPDDDEYEEVRDALLGELDAALDMPDEQRDELISDVQVFLDWRYHYSDGVLDEFSAGDLTEFLLEWCPRKLSQSADACEAICESVGAYFEFMARTGRLVGGAYSAKRLKKLAVDLVPTMREEMSNPANFGMAKTLLDGLDLSGVSVEEVQAAVNARMNEFNALPFEERRALTDDVIGMPPERELYELPFLYVPPVAADVEDAAAAAPLAVKVEALREYLGPEGKTLTTKGNLKLADGRALIELLDTGDEMDPKIGDKTWRTVSTADLRGLAFILDLAKEAGAVRVYQRRLVPVKAWTTRSTVQRLEALFAAIIDLGPLQSRFFGRIWFFDQLHQLLDDGIVHWLAPMLGDEHELPFDSIVEWGLSVARQHIPLDVDFLDEQTWERFTQRDIAQIFDVLEMAGVVRWTDRIEVAEPYGGSYWTGGTVILTALGRHVLPDYLDEAGYVLRRIGDIAQADAEAFIEALLSVAESQQAAVLAGWQPARPAIERVQMLAEAAVAAPTAAMRMMAFAALHHFDIDVAEPFVRQLLDTPVAGHAALWLMQRDRAAPAALGNFVDAAVVVDVLSTLAESPEDMCSFFAGVPEPAQLLEGMWRHAAPETAEVLDALGRYLPDQALAKAARKAAIRHRSWIANGLG